MITKKSMSALLLSGLLSMAATAAGKSDADMTFHGTLIEPPPCTINDGDRIDVDFGERVGINKVDGVNYRQVINYHITCESGHAGAWAMTLSLEGNAASFDGNALLTNKDNLGIRVYQNDTPFVPGSSLDIDWAKPPRLEAVPVKKAGSTLIEGAFDAWATLRADYH